ncbi:MAG: hypothetical protein PHS93_09690 [Candidatus Omnitrophica bacterium]|nr:hypothetical protein [Candidatus Omnitrophota bacterium]
MISDKDKKELKRLQRKRDKHQQATDVVCDKLYNIAKKYFLDEKFKGSKKPTKAELETALGHFQEICDITNDGGVGWEIRGRARVYKKLLNEL